MVVVKWKIGPRPQGRWRTPLEFSIEINGNQYAEYRPKLCFQKEYNLPGKVFMGDKAVYKREDGGACKTKTKVSVDIKKHFEKTDLLPFKIDLFRDGCRPCPLLISCKLYLECRKNPDYSDFEEVFRQIATDLANAWDKAVEDAMTYEACKGKEEVVTLKETFKINHENLTRRVKIS